MNSDIITGFDMQNQLATDTNFIKKRTISLCVIFTVLALLGTAIWLFAAVNFVFCIYVVFANYNKVVVPFLVYATFFASIFKILQITQMSFFTIVTFAYIIKLFLASINKIDSFYMIFFVFLSITFAVQFLEGEIDVNRNVKFYLNLLYMYAISREIDYLGDDDKKVSSSNVLYAFIFGVLASSLVRLLNGSIFDIQSFVEETTSNLGIGTEIYTRFSGLYGDPNYYAINVILALVVISYLFSRNKISTTLATGFFIVFAVFAIMTRSKSALLMLPIPCLTFVLASRKRKNHFFSAVLIFAIFLMVYMILTGKITWFDSILNRFEGNEDLNQLTTGRTGIWAMYFEYFFSNPLKFLCGSGISTPLLRYAAAHNTYVDILYHLGIIGGLLFVVMIKKIVVKKISFKRDINCYGPLIVIAMMYFFISSLFDIDLSTNILLITILYNTVYRREESVESC